MVKLRYMLTAVALFLLLGAGSAKAQWTVIDPSNIAQSIVNSTKELTQSTTTAQNMVRNFQETVKIYEQGKKYYDALRSVNNLVRDARKVQQTVLMLGHSFGLYPDSRRSRRCAGRTEECGEYHHYVDD